MVADLVDHKIHLRFGVDEEFTHFMLQHPELTFVLKVLAFFAFFGGSEFVHDILGLTFTVFKPLLVFRDHFKTDRSRSARGDSPLEFLRDPRRAQSLYSPPLEIAEALFEIWAARLRRMFVEGHAVPGSMLHLV